MEKIITSLVDNGCDENNIEVFLGIVSLCRPYINVRDINYIKMDENKSICVDFVGTYHGEDGEHTTTISSSELEELCDVINEKITNLNKIGSYLNFYNICNVLNKLAQ